MGPRVMPHTGQHHVKGLAQKGHARSLTPVDAGGLLPMRTLSLLTELLADPAFLGTQGRFDVGPGHPAWHPDRQTFDTDHHADAAPPRTLHRISHHRLAQHDFTLSLRMAELRHRELFTRRPG